MVIGREGKVFAGLAFGGFLDASSKIFIEKSASYGFPWNRIGNCRGSSESYDHHFECGRNGRKRPIVACGE